MDRYELNTQTLSAEASIPHSTVIPHEHERVIMQINEISIEVPRSDTERPSGSGGGSREHLQQWVLHHQITHNALNFLLSILRQNCDRYITFFMNDLLNVINQTKGYN